jgi:hypothetical protein
MPFITQCVKNGQIGEQCPFEWRSDSSEEEADTSWRQSVDYLLRGRERRKKRKEKG